MIQNEAKPARFRLNCLPDAYLDAGALPTPHDRYGISTAVLSKRIQEWLKQANPVQPS